MDEHLKATPQSGIWGNRNYRFFLTAALISSPGYFIYIIAVEWLMLTMYESRSYLGMMLFASTFARLLFMIYGGIIADRLNRRLVVLISQWSEMLLIASILACYLTDTLTPIFLIIVSFLFGIMDAFSGPAHSSMIVSITDKDSLQRANGLLSMAGQYSLIVGPLIGSTLIVTIGFAGVFCFVWQRFSFLHCLSLAFEYRRNRLNPHDQQPHGRTFAHLLPMFGGIAFCRLSSESVS